MARVDIRTESPASPQEAAEVMRALGEAGSSLRVRGGGTKFDWGEPCEFRTVVSTGGLNRVLEHNPGDMTAVLGAGTPLSVAQRAFAETGQMVALDPWTASPDDPGDRAATIGGIIAANDTGPLRHRYRSARDLVLGMTVALSDGTLARSGGKVIKNVAGYDIAKLFTGAFGTLGLIVEVVVRLHPRPARTLTAVASSDDPATLQEGALAAAHASLEIEALDVAYDGGGGRVLAQFGGVAPAGQVETVSALLEGKGLEVSVTDDDEALWDEQRRSQRARPGEIALKVSALPADLAHVVAVAAGNDGALVGRAGLGLFWLRLPGGDEPAKKIRALRSELTGRARHCVVLDADAATRAAAGVWGHVEPEAGRLMRAVKDRFDPYGVCAPGVFLEGI